MRGTVLSALALVATACGQGSEEATDAAVETATVEVAPPAVASRSASAPALAAAPAPAVGAVPPALPAQPNAPPQGLAPLLAYAYAYTIEAPSAGVNGLLRRHESACLAAGPLACQVVGASTQQSGEREVSAQLSFRAAPAYVARFRAGLAREVEGARGRVASSEVETEDLTRSIIDTEARLRAGRLLRARLESLIASRPGNLQQLLEIERELARVGGEIDAAESTLAVMRARVSMSTVTLDYASEGAVVDPGDSRPLAQAADGFARNLAASAAAILTFVSIVLPWALVLGLLGWAVATFARRERRRSAAKAPAPSTPADPPTPRPTDG